MKQIWFFFVFWIPVVAGQTDTMVVMDDLDTIVQVNEIQVSSPEFDRFLHQRLGFIIPVIGVEDLADSLNQVILLDARDEIAFNTSHIPGARRIGFRDFTIERVWAIPRDAPIVVYCTTGVQSEKVGAYLKNIGFTNVRNLYGSIIEWSNHQHRLVDNENRDTRKILIQENFQVKKKFLKRGRAIRGE